MNKESLEEVFICKNCENIGYYKYTVGENKLLECDNCKWRDTIVYCTHCDIYGEFVENVKDNPQSWTCPMCKNKISLPNEFYDNPIIVKMEIPSKNMKTTLINKEEKSTIHIRKLLWDLKKYYLLAYFIILVSILLDRREYHSIREILIAPFIMSFMIGAMIHDFVGFIKSKEKNRLNSEKLSTEGLISIGITMLLAFIYIALDVFLFTN